MKSLIIVLVLLSSVFFSFMVKAKESDERIKSQARLLEERPDGLSIEQALRVMDGQVVVVDSIFTYVKEWGVRPIQQTEAVFYVISLKKASSWKYWEKKILKNYIVLSTARNSFPLISLPVSLLLFFLFRLIYLIKHARKKIKTINSDSEFFLIEYVDLIVFFVVSFLHIAFPSPPPTTLSYVPFLLFGIVYGLCVFICQIISHNLALSTVFLYSGYRKRKRLLKFFNREHNS